ncbi:MAG: protein kinase [Elusimicrobia bacterium]|nr:protein kinase [Elusimicrobiota bacterium]
MKTLTGTALLGAALTLAPIGAQAGLLGRIFGGGGSSGGKSDSGGKGSGGGGGESKGGGHGGGIGSGAILGAIIGGIASMKNGGSFSEGAKAGAKAAGDSGWEDDRKDAARAGAAAAQGGGPSQGGGKPDYGQSQGKPYDGGPSYVQGHEGQVGLAVNPNGLTPAQAAALLAGGGGPGASEPGAPGTGIKEPPPLRMENPLDDNNFLKGDGGPGAVKRPEGPAFIIGSGTPAPPSWLARLDPPKQYEIRVPELPPGREYKGGQTTADAMAAHQKLGLDAVASVQGLNINAGEMRFPDSKGHPEGARRLASGRYADMRDGAQALRATLSSGESRYGLKDYKGALAEAESAIELAPGDPNGYLLYAKTLNKLGMHAKAEEAARQAEALASGDEMKSRALLEKAQAQLFMGRTNDAMASTAQAISLAQRAGNGVLEANGLYLQAAACQLKGDRGCMIAALERAALLDSKYYEALNAARAGKDIFDPKDTESLGLLDQVGTDGIPIAGGMATVWAVMVSLVAALAGAAGWAWRRSRRAPPKPTIAEALGVADNGLLAGKYALGLAVPSGGRGEMWEAKDQSLGRSAQVLKLASGSAADDARRLASVHHPGVVDVFEVIEGPRGTFLVHEFLKGRSLRQVLAAKGPMRIDEACRMLRPVCEALEYARAQGVVCGGLELIHVMLTDDGYVKLVDLPVARAEQLGRSDVQAVAECLGELLTGEPPRPGKAPAVGAGAAALIADASSGAIPGPAALAQRLTQLADAVAVG